jgi:hypothetical protein
MAIAQREPSTRKTWPAKRPSAGPIAHNQIYRRIGEEAALLRGLFFKPELYADSISALSFRYLTAPVPRDATGLLMRALFVGRLKARPAAVGADAAADWSVGFCRSTINGACSQNCSRPMVVARTIPSVFDEPEVNVFACKRCGAGLITEDHLTIAGTAVP